MEGAVVAPNELEVRNSNHHKVEGNNRTVRV
jgi:hypothetical protein